MRVKITTSLLLTVMLMAATTPPVSAQTNACLDLESTECNLVEEIERAKNCKWELIGEAIEYIGHEVQKLLEGDENEEGENQAIKAEIGLCVWVEAALYVVDDSECEDLGLVRALPTSVCGHNDLTVGGDSQLFPLIALGNDDTTVNANDKICEHDRLSIPGPWEGCSKYIGHHHWHSEASMSDNHIVSAVALDGPTTLTPIRAASMQSTYNDQGYVDTGSWP